MSKEKKKMGRPTDNPKTEKIGIRITKSDLDKLAFCSKKLEKSRADVIALSIRETYNKIKKD